jgi:transcriptional regulator with XRE-family HTH domain
VPTVQIDSGATAAEGPVLGKAILRAADRLGLTARTLCTVVGLSEPTVSRLKRGEFTLDRGTKPFELAVLFVRLYRSLDAIVGGDEAVARAWLRNDNTALGGKPLETIQTVPGLVDAIAYLDARRAIV